MYKLLRFFKQSLKIVTPRSVSENMDLDKGMHKFLMLGIHLLPRHCNKKKILRIKITESKDSLFQIKFLNSEELIFL